MTGQEFLAQTAGGNAAKQRAPLLVQQGEAQILAWETVSMSADSPGPVRNLEDVLRAMDDPVHWCSFKQEFTPGAFSDIKSIGLSVQRTTHVPLSQVVEKSSQRIAGKSAPRHDGTMAPRRLVAFVRFNVGVLRSQLGPEDQRLFVIYDTGKKGDEAHADIFCCVSDRSKAYKRAKSIIFDLALAGLCDLAGSPATGHDITASLAGGPI